MNDFFIHTASNYPHVVAVALIWRDPECVYHGSTIVRQFRLDCNLCLHERKSGTRLQCLMYPLLQILWKSNSTGDLYRLAVLFLGNYLWKLVGKAKKGSPIVWVPFSFVPTFGFGKWLRCCIISVTSPACIVVVRLSIERAPIWVKTYDVKIPLVARHIRYLDGKGVM